MTAEVLLIEPYFGGSHESWARGVAAHSGHSVHLLTHPARWWKWRMRGGAVTLAEGCADLARPPDAVLVSDMVDVAAFRTLARPHIGDPPLALYFHESQFTYPFSPLMDADLQFALTNWTSSLAADEVWFNSDFHLESFFGEAGRLLRGFPDLTHGHLVENVRARSQVLPVGVDLSWVKSPERRQGPIRLVWNHRWEHDKDPLTFFSAIDELATEGLDFELVVLGMSFRVTPAEFEAAARRHADRIVQFGHAEVGDYRAWLSRSDVVVSTALQEFFGVAVVEAIAAGCMPVLPNRLSYPGLVPGEWHDACLYEEGELVDRLRTVVSRPEETRRIGEAIAPAMGEYDWSVMGPRYGEAIGRLAARRPHPPAARTLGSRPR